MRNDAAEAGKLHGWAGAVASEHVMSASLMRSLTMGHGSNDADFIEDLGDMGKLLTDVFASHTFDWTEGTAVVWGCVWLGVPGFMLGHAAGQIDMDDGGSDCFVSLHRWHVDGCGLKLQQLGQSDAQSCHGPDLEEVTTTLLIAEELAVIATAEGVHFHDGNGVRFS